ncbi:MAG: PfkB family carbohydrate kinase [Thermoplasmata archaeon]
MGKKYDVVSIGSANQDVYVRSNLSKLIVHRDLLSEKKFLCYDYGAKVNVDTIEFQTGGGGTNAAVCFSRLGLKTAYIGKVGKDDAGRAVISELEREGVDTSMVSQTSEYNTGYSVVLTSFEGDRTILVYRGANNHLTADDLPFEKLKETDWLYISTLTGKSGELLDAVAEFAEKNGISVAHNPGTTQIKRGLEGMRKILKTLEVLILNKEEAAAMTGMEYSQMAIDLKKCIFCGTCIDVCKPKLFKMCDGTIIVTKQESCIKCGICVERCPTQAVTIEPWADNTDAIMKKLYEYGPKLVVITDGAKGVQVYDGKYRYLFPAYPAVVADTTGAGDSFAAGFLTGWIKKRDVEYAIRLGSANAASNIEKVGAKTGTLTLAQAEEYINAHPMTVRKKEL